jgi:Pyridine nucleotide-disulphide oxidoreductase
LDNNDDDYKDHRPFTKTLITMKLVAACAFLLLSSSNAFGPVVIVHNHNPPSVSRRDAAVARLDASKCGQYDFDVAIIGCGVGGHGAALHARAQDLATAVFVGGDVGGTCVNRGCVPSKALLAAAGRVRDMQNAHHLADLGITVEGEVKFDRAGIAAHAANLANKVKGNLEGSLTGLGVDMIEGRGALTGTAHEVKDEKTGKIYTAKVRWLGCTCMIAALRIARRHHISIDVLTFGMALVVAFRISSWLRARFPLSHPALSWTN